MLPALLIAVPALLLAVPVLADVLSLVAAAFGGSKRDVSAEDAAGPPPRLLFLVPAHDEELLIGRCVGSVTALNYPASAFSIVVVADNCTDRTAEVARTAGAEVLERSDTRYPGKPRAIAWALSRLDLSVFEGVVILDADSRVDPGYGSVLATAGPIGQKLVQGYNDVSNASESELTRMAAVFSAARCIFMNGLKRNAGLTVPPGNGFCYGARILETRGWQEFSIVEDWEIYARLTAEGYEIDNQPGAHVYSQEARSMGQSASQRRRWTAGKLEVLVREAWPILRSRNIGVLQKIDAVGELLAPGPVVLASVAVVAIAGVLALGIEPMWPLVALLAAPVLRIGIYTLLGLSRVEQPIRTGVAFLFLPVYAVWRLGVQLSAMVSTGRSPWTRTTRHQEDEVPLATAGSDSGKDG